MSVLPSVTVDSSPVDSSPVDSSPVDSSPVDSSPVDSSPVDSSPVDSSQRSRDETARLAALRACEILDTPPEPAFDRLTNLASRLFDVPIALISLVDGERQWFKSHHGLRDRQTDRAFAFCAHAIADSSGAMMVVPDATQDARFVENPNVLGEPYIRFYAGAPLRSLQGYLLGTLCIIDTQPRDLSPADRDTLRDLAALVVDEIGFRLTGRQLEGEVQRRREVQNALDESQSRFGTVFERSAIGMAVVSLEGRFQQVNPKLCEILGYERKELQQLTYPEFTHPDDLAACSQLFNAVLRGERESYTTEKRFLHSEGHGVWCSVSVSVVRDNGGQPLFLTSQVQDISMRKQAELALQHSQARKMAILETALDSIVVIDHEGCVLEWNPSAVTTFGYSREEALGKELEQLIIPYRLREAHLTGIQRSIETGQRTAIGKRLEVPAMRSDGTEIDVELAIVPIPGVEPPLFVGHLRDITQRKRIDDALWASQARYNRMVANMPGAVYQFLMQEDGSFSFPFISEGCREIMGLSPQEIMNDPQCAINCIFPEERPAFFQTVLSSAEHLTPWAWEGRIITPTGERKWMRGNSRPAREGTSTLWDGLLYDTTQRKREEEALQVAKLEAESARVEADLANRAKSEFLSRMSHELRTPLNAILGFGQLLEISPLSPGDAQSTQHILKAGRHLLNLINEVLEIARIEAGHLNLVSENLSVCEIAIETLDLVRPMAAARGIDLDEGEARGCSLEVHADRQKFRQILLNLLSNAIKYNRENGSVSLDFQQNKEFVLLGVRDTGHGIASELLPRLWMPFDRLGAENSSVEGSGVGLAVSQSLARAMNGVIDVESEPGVGTTFWIKLPRSSESPVAQKPRSTMLVPNLPLTTRLLVLYIEDNPSNLQLVQRALKYRPDIRLLTATEGETGCELALRHTPDVILLDLHLPDIDGFEVLRRLRQDSQTASIPVIMLSADAISSQIQRALDAGARKYLTKPINVKELLWCLDQISLNRTLS